MSCNLSKGSKANAKIKQIQTALQKKGYYKGCKIDGIYGDYTVAAVKQFQKAKGLTVDGCIGCETWPKLVGTTCPWSTSSSSSSSSSSTSVYVKATKNCQVNDPTVQAKAKTLKKSTVYATGLAIFNYVRDAFDYSYYYNTKYGAVKALIAKVCNCVDDAHTIIALARAVGIPARYAHCPSVKFTKITTGHVWAELYINGKWIRADGTNNNNQFGVNPYDSQLLTSAKYYSELPF